MKRFTETTKWEDPWFRGLDPTAKLLWYWLLDHCDISGVIRPDLQLASFQIGQLVDQETVAALGDRVRILPDGKWHIPKFVRFQFGELSTKSNVHQSVMRILSSHGLPLPNPFPTLGQPLTLALPLPRGCPTPKEKEKEKEKEPEKDKSRGVAGGNGSLDTVFARDLMAAYRRTADSRLTYLEESTLAEIIREHPRYREEWDIIITLKQRESQYFPKSLAALLTKWQETLDRAVNYKPKNENSDHKEMQEVIHIKEL